MKELLKKLWARRTDLEKILLILSSLLLFICFIITIVLFASGGAEHEKEPDVCTTESCVRAAAGIISALDPTVDPCEDFFEYACGKWIREHPIPDDMSRYGMLTFVNDQVTKQMRVLFESSDSSLSSAIDMAKLTYQQCMNKTELADLKSSELLKIFEELGYWPIVNGDKWKEKQFDVTELLANGRIFDDSVFVTISVSTDAKNASRNVLHVDQGHLVMVHDYFLNETKFAEQLKAYRNYLSAVVQLLIADANESRATNIVDQDLKDIFEFEIKLAKIMVPLVDRRNYTKQYNIRQVKDLATMLPQIRWLDYLRTVMPEDVQSFFTNDTEIIVCEIEYLKNLSKLLHDTPDRVKANYILWRVAGTWTKMLDDRYEEIDQNFQRMISGRQQKPQRWKKCTASTISTLPLAAGSLYVRKHFDALSKHVALGMIGNLRESFTEVIQSNDWMDDQTKNIAIEKIAALADIIGYPDYIINDTALDEYYSLLDIQQSDNYFGTRRKISHWLHAINFRKLLIPVDRLEFGRNSPAEVNAFYSPSQNSIKFLAGILQPPMFDGGFPKAVNYGAIGSVIGHEITHGFDDQGSQFDKDGNLRNWWSPVAHERFKSRTQCLIDQYSAYQLPGTEVNVNGKLTQGENIADNGGAKESYLAYQKYIQQLGYDEPRLPGLTNYTNDQIFFLSYAHSWCGHAKKEAALLDALRDSHSPYRFRVVGVMSNMPQFAAAFNCPENSRLNPAKRCAVW